MQKTINKYQSKFDGLMKSIEKDKILKKMQGNATAGIVVQMIKDLKNYLRVNKKGNKESIIKIDRRSKNSAYITIGNWVVYVDNSTGEHIIDSWEE
jgi:hypothetical protein